MNKRLKNVYRLNTKKFGIIRGILLIVGVFILSASLLSLFFSKNWLYFIMFVGLMLINFSLSGYCPMAIILDEMGLDRD